MPRKSLFHFTHVTLLSPDKKTAILRNISFSVKEGEWVIILGANGSGKSSLLKLCSRQTTPHKGQLYLDGELLKNISRKQLSQDIVMLNQDTFSSVFPSLTLQENLSLGSMRSQIQQDNWKAYIASFQKSLASKLHQPACCLSGGQRQTLALAICLLCPPKMILLDEHTSALDPKAKRETLALTQKWVQEKGIATIMTTHHFQDAMTFGDRIIALKEGKIILDVSGEEKKALSYEKLLSLYE